MKLGKFQIHPAVFCGMLLFLLQGNGIGFILTIVFVSLHEGAHCIGARLMGVQTAGIVLTPMGERAILPSLSSLSASSKLLVYFIGPLVNLTLGLFFHCFFHWSNYGVLCGNINLLLFFFNLLPFLPLDGGCIALLLGGRIWGTLRTGKNLVRFSRIFGFVLILLGLVQAVLYPLNISLLLMGLYLRQINKHTYSKIVAAFYRHLIGKEERRLLPVRFVFAGSILPLGQLISRFSEDFYYFVYVQKGSGIVLRTQEEIGKKVLEAGLSASLLDI